EGLPLVAHIAETRDAVEIIRKNFHKTPLQVLSDYGALRKDTLLLHANYLSDQDVEILRTIRSPVVVCPRSTAYKQTGYPALRQLFSSDLTLALGTDWGTTDVVCELRFVADLPYLIAGMPARSPAGLLRMATVDAAAALGLSGEIGSIEVGKRADLTFFTLRDRGLPVSGSENDPDHLAGMIIRHHSAVRITDVMIDGEFYLEDSQLRTIEEEEVVREVARLLDRYYPMSQVVEQHPVHERSAARVLPLMQEHDPGTTEGYEEGFSVIGPAHSHHRPAPTGEDQVTSQPVSQPENRKKITRQPELSKNVRRVFGDDDEV
ncbi:MAG: amidohydrolase family protein, partial [Ignavibacteria bacterium]|nr:amidohydrolase family protein [Ignavibacteria bacterium]